MIAKGFNAIDGYRIFDREENGGLLVLTPRSNEHPSMVVISNDNPFIPVSPGITRRHEFTFYRNWNIGMPELTSRYEFAMANIDGLTVANMINGNTYSDRAVSIEFIQPTRIGFTQSTSFASDDFIEWSADDSYLPTTMIRFPYGMMTLENEYAVEISITYTAHTVSHTWPISSIKPGLFDMAFEPALRLGCTGHTVDI